MSLDRVFIARIDVFVQSGSERGKGEFPHARIFNNIIIFHERASAVN